MTIPRNLGDLANNVDSNGTLGVAGGGTGATTLAANNVLLGNGTAAPLTVAPGTNGNVLTSNGTTWTSAPLSATVPVGTIQYFAGATTTTYPGSSWLPCDGAVYSQSTYPALYGILGNIQDAIKGPYYPNIINSGISTTSTLYAVEYSSGFTSGFIGGAGGLLLRTANGSSWSAVTSGTTSSILSVSVANTGYTVNTNYYVYAGQNGVLRTSTNGVNWTSRTSGTASDINDVSYGKGGLAYVTSNGTIHYSDNAQDWTQYAPASAFGATAINGGTSGNQSTSRYMVVGAGGAVYTSFDANSWTARTSGTASALNTVAYGPNNTVYVAAGVGNNARYSFDGGATWGAVTSTASTINASVFNSNNVTFYIGGAGGVVQQVAESSLGSLSFAAVTSGTTAAINSMMSDGTFVYYGDASGNIRRTNNTTSFVTLGTTSFVNGVAYGSTPQLYALATAVGIFYKNNADNSWQVPATSTGTYNAAFYESTANYFIFGGSGGNIRYSYDLPTGTSASVSNTTSAINAFAYGASTIIYCGAGGVIGYSSGPGSFTVATSGTTSALNAATFGNGLFVVGGAGGVLRSSTDGITWSSVTSGTTSIINALAYINNLYIVCGAGGMIRTSTDLVTWSAKTSGTANALRAIAYNPGNGYYYVAGAAGTLLTSTDLDNWTARDPNTTTQINALAYGTQSGGEVIYGGNGNAVIGGALGISNDSTGSVWRTWNAGTTSAITAMHYASTGLRLIAGTGGVMRTSTDGLLYTPVTSGTSSNILSLTYEANTATYMYSTAGGGIGTSSDGVNWTVRSSGTVSNITTLVSFNALTRGYPTIAAGAGGYAAASNDGGVNWFGYGSALGTGVFKTVSSLNSNWFYGGAGGQLYMGACIGTLTPRTSNTSSQINSITYGGNLYFYGTSGGGLGTSTDGITWTTRTSGTASNINSVFYTGSLYAYAGDGGVCGTSTDGITWTARTSGTASNINAVNFSTNPLVNNNGVTGSLGYFVGNGGLFGTTGDAIAWSIPSQTNASIVNLSAIIYAGSLFVAGGNTGSLATSTNGATWVTRTSNTTGNITSFAYAADKTNKYVATTSTALSYLTSTDGITWSQRSSGLSNTINKFAYGNGVYVAAQTNGFIATSTDAVTWNSFRVSSSYTNSYTDIAYGGDAKYKFVAITSDFATAISKDGITWQINRIAYNGISTVAVAYGNGVYVLVAASAIAVSATNNYMFISTDGENWIRTNTFFNTYATSGLGTISWLTFSGGLFYAYTTRNDLYSSVDGVTWEVVGGNVSGATSVATGNNITVLANSNNYLLARTSVSYDPATQFAVPTTNNALLTNSFQKIYIRAT